LIGTILESKNLSAFAEALMQRYQTDVAAKFPTTDQVANRRKPQFLFENSSVFQHDQTTAGVSHFFGVSDAAVGEIRLESNPSDSHFPFFLRNRQLNRLLLWLVVTVFLFILSIRFSFWELFIQFPHFWGIVTGLLLWNLFPFGFLGITILLMTIFSFFYPAWNGCQELTEQTTTQ
jgi:hypothetical protein